MISQFNYCETFLICNFNLIFNQFAPTVEHVISQPIIFIAESVSKSFTLPLGYKRKRMRKIILLGMIVMLGSASFAQTDRWQQQVSYQMDIQMDVSTNQFKGTQELTYFNNSPDTLRKVFFHLYFNAFQPGSMMDVRSRTLPDPDRRVKDRIFLLNKDEIGFKK